jgi:hypothetical protein
MWADHNHRPTTNCDFHVTQRGMSVRRYRLRRTI